MSAMLLTLKCYVAVERRVSCEDVLNGVDKLTAKLPSSPPDKFDFKGETFLEELISARSNQTRR